MAIPRAETQIMLNQAGLLLSQAHGLLDAICERDWEGSERDPVAIKSQILYARLGVSNASFKTHAACGLFIPKEERGQ